MDQPIGLAASGAQRNARVSHIRKFVCLPPERGHLLRLITCEDPPMVLGEWTRAQSEDNAVAAEEVDARLREHASTQQSEVTANLVWQTDQGLVCVSKRLKCRPESDPSMGDPAQNEALGLVGSETGRMVQMQRHHEIMMRGYWAAHQTQIGQLNHTIGLLGGLLNESLTAAHKAHVELDKVRAQQRRELDQEAERRRDELGRTEPLDPEKVARAEILTQVASGFSQALPTLLEMAAEKVLGMESVPDNDNGSPPQSGKKSG